jgi:hypothetical protein
MPLQSMKNFCGGYVTQSLVVFAVFCRSLFFFVIFLLTNALSTLQFTASNYPLAIFKDEEEVDPLVVKAEQLERHSEEINNRLKVNTEMPWEYISWFSSVFVTTILDWIM